jgi:hypothetical protein
LSITFILCISPDSAPISVSRVLRDCRRLESESELTFCRGSLFGVLVCCLCSMDEMLIYFSLVFDSSGLPTYLSASTSRQHPGLYLHHRQCCACLCHRPLEPPLATPASTVVAQAASLESAPRQRRTPLKATSPTHHVVHRRCPLQRPAASTTPLWRTFPRASKSSRVCFL